MDSYPRRFSHGTLNFTEGTEQAYRDLWTSCASRSATWLCFVREKKKFSSCGKSAWFDFMIRWCLRKWKPWRITRLRPFLCVYLSPNKYRLFNRSHLPSLAYLCETRSICVVISLDHIILTDMTLPFPLFSLNKQNGKVISDGRIEPFRHHHLRSY